MSRNIASPTATVIESEKIGERIVSKLPPNEPLENPPIPARKPPPNEGVPGVHGDDILNVEVLKGRKEVARLVKNQVALFDVMSDMVFLIRVDFVIEYMNASAIAIFGNLCGQICHEVMHNNKQSCPNCPLEQSQASQGSHDLFELKFGKVYVEYNYASFQGYRDEQLVMIVMRDITKRKSQEAELNEFHTNIESVLHHKIQALNESERVQHELSREVNLLKRELDHYGPQQDKMVGVSRKFRELRKLIHHVADSDATILITGESGTGKELVADILHQRSQRNGKPFLKLNCSAIAEGLLESDLFGHEKGAFTGADTKRIGKFEVADNGSIFLDEIGDISPRMQAALLRVLQNGEIVRVGGNNTLNTNVRIITATNVDLAAAVKANKFRRDLYYRLNGINIHLPPLRERQEDIIPLIAHFIKKYRTAFEKKIDYLPNRIIDRLVQHEWPGNIRELENVIRRAVLLAKDNVITEKELSFEPDISSAHNERAEFLIEKRMLEQPLKESMEEIEAKILASAVDLYNGNSKLITRILKLGKTTFYEKMKRYGLFAAPK